MFDSFIDKFKKIKQQERHEFNKDKDCFIKDLIAKVNYLETVLKEYQKKYYIPKYAKLLEFSPQLVDAEKVKRLYNNMKIMEQMKIEEIEKNGGELKKELDSRAANTNADKNVIAKSNAHTNMILKVKAVNSDADGSKAAKSNKDVQDVVGEVQEEHNIAGSDKRVSRKVAERPKTPGDLRSTYLFIYFVI